MTNFLIASIVVLSLMIQHASAQDYTPPTKGKFFYAGLKYDNYRSYVTLGAGNPAIQTNLHFNSEELTMALFTTNCTNPVVGQACGVPNPYKPVNETDGQRVTTNTSFEIAYLYQRDSGDDTSIGGIRKVEMSGMEATASLNVTLPMFLRQFVYTGHIFEVIQLNQPYSSDLISGMVGFGPYTAVYNQNTSTSRVQVDENFLYELWNKDIIDHQVIAFYVGDDNNVESMVKVGSYDPEGFLDSDNFQLLKTSSLDSWAILSQELGWVNNDGIMHMITNRHDVIIEPAYPFIYVPSIIYDALATLLETHLAQISFTKTDEYIRFDKSCTEVGQDIMSQHGEFNFAIVFDQITQASQISLQDLLVEPQFLNPRFTSGSCYLGIFPNTNAKNESIVYLGQVYLRSYYTFFDASGYQSGQSDSLYVGTGRKDPNAQILKQLYNSSTWNYEKNDGDQSQWVYVPNKFTQDPLTARNQDKSGSEIVDLAIIVLVSIVLITAISCVLECLRKRQERRMLGEDQKSSDQVGLIAKQTSQINGSIDITKDDKLES